MAEWVMEQAYLGADFFANFSDILSLFGYTRVSLDNPPFTMIQTSEANVNYSLDGMTNRGNFTNDFEKFMIYRQGGRNLIDVARKVSSQMKTKTTTLRSLAAANATSTSYILGLREMDPWKFTRTLTYEQNILRMAAQEQLKKRDSGANLGNSPLFIRNSQLAALKSILKSYIDDRFTDFREGTIQTVGVPADLITKFRKETGNKGGIISIRAAANRIFADHIKLKDISFDFDPDLFLTPDSFVQTTQTETSNGDDWLQGTVFYMWAVDHATATYPSTLTSMTYSETQSWLMDRHQITAQEADRICKNHILNEAIRIYNILTAGIDSNEYNFPIDYNINEFYIRVPTPSDEIESTGTSTMAQAAAEEMLENLENLSVTQVSQGGWVYPEVLGSWENCLGVINSPLTRMAEIRFKKKSEYSTSSLSTSLKAENKTWMAALSNFRYATDYNIGRMMAPKNFGRVFNLYININDFPLDETAMDINLIDANLLTTKTDSLGNTYYYTSTREQDTGNVLLNDNLAQYDFTVEFK